MTYGYTEVIAVFKRAKAKPQPKESQDNDKMLVELWRAENDARKADGLPPIPYEIWVEWYRWRHKESQQGDRL
jgi:hypothetical protein